jgi:pimeloyl-ACP methyl ester carboxylesterase
LFPVEFGPGFETKQIGAGEAAISLTVGGSGPAVLLLHGYAEDSRMWKPLAVPLQSRFTVIAPDLPGIGNSAIPSSGLDMVTSARRVHDVVHALGYNDVRVVGHDIGLMVAYAYAAMYRSEVNRLALMDAFLPGVEGWEAIYDSPGTWHFRFYGPTPLALVEGRERIYFEHFWNDFAADRTRSIPEKDREAYATAYARSGRMAAGFAYFASFLKTAEEFSEFAKTQIAIPLLTVGGEKSLGVALGDQGRLVAKNATAVVVRNAGHWIIEEQPQETMAALIQFLNRP